MRRRRFLGVISASAAGVLTGGLSKLVAAASASTSKTGGTFLLVGDRLVNRLGFGAMRLTGEGIWGWPPDRESAKKVLRRAVELGVNFIDTADAYGPETNELLIAEALYPYPKGLIIATKGGNTRPSPAQWVPDGRPEYLTQAVDKSLKRLKLERIDLWQLHRIDHKVPVAGKIRHVGLSEVTVAEIEQAKKVVPIVSIQNRYNITDRESEAALNYCEKQKMGFIPWAPIGGSGTRSLSKAGNALEAEAKRHNVRVVQLALAWLLQKSPVMLPIPGTSSLAHLEENIAAEQLQLSAEEWKRIEALARQA